MAETTKTKATPKAVKKAVIASGGKQYIVNEGQELEIEVVRADKTLDFDCLALIDGDTVEIGAPIVEKVKVSAQIVEPLVKADKVVAIRFKAKKRVHKRRGHRQQLARIKVVKIG
ncbi:50S ribosomal protein L21 [Candidatus Saccharibacteria bacterium]|nr:50S ribosomal protein L21 [Candidatus Saccharibacteria bacterium]